MTGLVVDASIAAAWLFDDEENPQADGVLEHLKEYGALVPHLWHLEIRNILLVAERRGRISRESASKRLNGLKGLPIRTDEDPDLQSAFDLARTHGLSFYDALYLELARREGAGLATSDRALGRAAFAEGVPLSLD